MTAPDVQPASTGGGLLGKLLAAVRPEFRVEVYLPSRDDPVLGRPPCAVPGCDRSGWEYGLCGGGCAALGAAGPARTVDAGARGDLVRQPLSGG